mgnify:CR=1 FL=1
MKTQFNAYLPEKLLQASLIQRARLRQAPATPDSVPTVWIAVDPASHGKSDMGLCAVVAGETVAVVGCASVSVARCQVLEVQAIIAGFLEAVRGHFMVDRSSPIVPIIECNNNEVMAASLLSPFRQYGPVRPRLRPLRGRLCGRFAAAFVSRARFEG